MNFFEELKRRNVFRVGVAYTVAAWVLLQVADLVLDNINAPDWVIQAMMMVVALGFFAAQRPTFMDLMATSFPITCIQGSERWHSFWPLLPCDMNTLQSRTGLKPLKTLGRIIQAAWPGSINGVKLKT